MKTFNSMKLNPNLLKTIEELGFKEPTEIQEKVIPLALEGKDILGGSATGSGKTLAFGAPIINKIHRGKGIQALILTPTRELAEQVASTISSFSKHSPLFISSVYGGVSILPQIESLRIADVVVGTPGRILDHLSRKTIDLSQIKILVLDEADRMLDMGFYPDVTEIISHCPKKRQTMLFSATISEQVIKISRKYMDHPIDISIDSYVDPAKLAQFYYDVSANEKFSLLVHLLKNESSKLVMVFCNTKRNADFIGKNLRRYGFDALALHGDLSQQTRIKILQEFHKHRQFTLVCTDVAARGLDIKNVSHIYNYDTPKTSIEYIHRIGRTARAGKEGKAITLIADRDYENFTRVLRDSSLKIQEIPLPQFEKVLLDTKKTFIRGNFGKRRFPSHNNFRHRQDNRRYSGHRASRFGSIRTSRFGSRGNRSPGRRFK